MLFQTNTSVRHACSTQGGAVVVCKLEVGVVSSLADADAVVFEHIALGANHSLLATPWRSTSEVRDLVHRVASILTRKAVARIVFLVRAGMAAPVQFAILALDVRHGTAIVLALVAT